MNKRFFVALIVIGLFLSCSSERDTATAEAFFKDFLTTAKIGHDEELISMAPFLGALDSEQKDATLLFFRSVAESDYRLTSRFVGHGIYAMSVYLPDSSGSSKTYIINCEKNADGSWSVLPDWEQKVLIDRISLDSE